MRYFTEHAWSSYVYVQLLQILLPCDNQVAYLKKTFGIESLQTIFNGSCSPELYLRYLKEGERIAYLIDIIGQDCIATHIRKKGWMIFQNLPIQDRLAFLQEGIDINELRALVSIYGEDRIVGQMIVQLLPEDAQSEFLEMLLSDADKSARTELNTVKDVICRYDFSVGFWGMGYAGKTITLDDGRKKDVPGTVAQQWKHIKDAENRLVSYLEAWEAVRTLGVKAANKPGGYTRAGETSQYYERFLHAPQYNEEFPGGHMTLS